MARTASSSRSLTDPEESRQCVDEPGATPAREQEPGSDTHAGLIRFDFPGLIGEQSLEAIGWDEWFKKFKESNLPLLVQDDIATGLGGHCPPPHVMERKLRRKRKLAVNRLIALGAYSHAGKQPENDISDHRTRSRIVVVAGL